MQNASLPDQFKQAILKPEPLWREKAETEISWKVLLKSPVLPVIIVVAAVSALLTLLFGYHIPVIGVVRPTIGDTVMQAIGTIVIYTVSILAFGWVAAWLAGMMGGRDDMNRSVAMFFWVSIPSLLGQVLSPIPMIGWVIGLGLGIYTLVLLYRAIPVFLEVPLESRVKHFILFVIISIAFSMLLGSTLGKLFEPTGMYEKMQNSIPIASEISKKAKEANKSPDKYIEDYIGSMMGGDYGQKVVEESAEDTFTPPKDNLLTPRQVMEFVALAKKVAIVQKEQAEALKLKYDKKEKQDDPSFTDIFNGLKDLSSIATLEMKVVKSNGGNWAEYQWVKDRIREAYYTPSLNETTKKNAELIKNDREIISGVL